MVLVVGIPTKNEAKTIAKVTKTMDEGLFRAYPDERCIIINADSSSTDGTEGVFQGVKTKAEKISIATAAEGTGKGTNVLAIMRKAQELGADAVCLVDGDLRSAQSTWAKSLIDAALSHDGPTFVTPEYTRNRYEANTTNQLVVPYLRAAFGLDIRQPIGGEFAMNAGLIEEALTWQRYESTHLYGIDVWLTVNTALRDLHLEHVHIGRKLHNPTFPKIYRLGQEVLDTLFRLMMQHRPATPCTITSAVDHDLRVDEVANRLPSNLVDPVTKRAADYAWDNWDDLVYTFPALLTTGRPAKGELPHIETNLWCEILTEAYCQLDIDSFRRVRDHLVGLFPARVVTYWGEVTHMSAVQVDALLEYQSSQLAEAFAGRAIPTEPVDVSGTPELIGGFWRTSPSATPAPQK